MNEIVGPWIDMVTQNRYHPPSSKIVRLVQ